MKFLYEFSGNVELQNIWMLFYWCSLSLIRTIRSFHSVRYNFNLIQIPRSINTKKYLYDVIRSCLVNFIYIFYFVFCCYKLYGFFHKYFPGVYLHPVRSHKNFVLWLDYTVLISSYFFAVVSSPRPGYGYGFIVGVSHFIEPHNYNRMFAWLVWP